jgi:chitinase
MHGVQLYPSRENPKTTPFSTDQAVKYYVANGISAHNLVIGMPLYGRAFIGTDGPGCGHQGGGEGSWEQGVWDYKVSFLQVSGKC